MFYCSWYVWKCNYRCWIIYYPVAEVCDLGLGLFLIKHESFFFKWRSGILGHIPPVSDGSVKYIYSSEPVNSSEQVRQ